MMKVCRTCGGDPQPLDDFHKHPQMADGHLNICKKCRCKYQNDQYATEHGRAMTLRSLAKRRKRNRMVVDQHLDSHHCADCNESDPHTLEFDHVRGVKSEHVSKLIQNATSEIRLKAEIAKCDVVCANCHRRRTAITYGSYRLAAAC